MAPLILICTPIMLPVVTLFAVLMLVTYVPIVSLWLPHLLKL
jgi:hypothetical protein